MANKNELTTWHLAGINLLFLVIAVNVFQVLQLSGQDNYRYSALHQYETFDVYGSLLRAQNFNRKFSLTYALRQVSDDAVLYVPNSSEYLAPGSRERFRITGMGNIHDIGGYDDDLANNILPFVVSGSLDRFLVDSNSFYVETDSKTVYDPSLPGIKWTLYAQDDLVQEFVLVIDDKDQHTYIDTRLLDANSMEGIRQ